MVAWASYLFSGLPVHLIVKDREGAHCSGLRVFDRVGERFIAREDGDAFDGAELARVIVD